MNELEAKMIAAFQTKYPTVQTADDVRKVMYEARGQTAPKATKLDRRKPKKS